MGKQDNAGRFERGYLKVTTENFTIGICPDAKSLRKPMNRGTLKKKNPDYFSLLSLSLSSRILSRYAEGSL